MRTLIDGLRQRLPPPVLVPRGEGGLNLIREAPEVDTLVLPGGGAKGVSYVGLMRVMKQDGAFSGVRHLVGSSAGALAATLLAFTDDDAAMQTMLADELPTLLDTRADLRDVYPALRFHDTMSLADRAIWRLKGGKPLGDANGLVQKIDRVTSVAAKNYVDAMPDDERDKRLEDYARDRKLDPQSAQALRQRVEILRQAPDFSSDRTDKMVTFRDADMLHHFAPERFRTVACTAYAPETGEIHYFDAELTPEVPLAYATRASLSHPLLATGVQIGADGPTLIDGGLRSNIPTETVYDREMARALGEPQNREDEQRRAQTMVGKFDNGSAAETVAGARPAQRSIITRALAAIYAYVSSIPRRLANWFTNWFMHRVSLNPRLDADRALDQHKHDSSGANGILMHHGSLRTTDLNVSAERQRKAIDDNYAGLREQLRQREDQAWFVSVDSVKEAYSMLTDEEKARILDQGLPASPDASARDAAIAARESAEFAVLHARAGVDEDVLAEAERDLGDAERRADRATSAYQHAVKRQLLAVEFYRMAEAERSAGALSSSASSPSA